MTRHRIGRRPRVTLRQQIETHPRVIALEVEETDGWFLTLRSGWRMAYDPLCPVHCGGASTISEALKLVRSAVACDCGQCRDELARGES